MDTWTTTLITRGIAAGLLAHMSAGGMTAFGMPSANAGSRKSFIFK